MSMDRVRDNNQGYQLMDAMKCNGWACVKQWCTCTMQKMR